MTNKHTSDFLGNLRDKITNGDLEPLFEEAVSNVTHIEHPEDLVFMLGTDGFKRALKIFQSLNQNSNNISIKWDGMPAIIYGRNNNGEFVLTDKSAFTAKTYDGYAKNIDDIKRIMSTRKGDRTDLINMYAKLFPLLSGTLPNDFRGYIWADLLYAGKPQVQDNNWVFTPNTVTYSIPVDSDLGQSVSNSEVGIAVHTYITPTGQTQPISTLKGQLPQSKQVLLFTSAFGQTPKIQVSPKYNNQAKYLLQFANDIDSFLAPQTLRMIKVTNLPTLIKRFVNTKVSEGNFNDLVQGFQKWLPVVIKGPRMEALQNHINGHKKALQAIFYSFQLLTQIKHNIISQLDKQNNGITAHVNGAAGHEGYVVNSDMGTIKLVDRIRFSRSNFAKNSKK